MDFMIYEAVVRISDVRDVPDNFLMDQVDVVDSIFHVILTVQHLYTYIISQERSFSQHNPVHETVVVKAKRIRDDFRRLFAELARADTRRVVWSIFNRSYECGGVVARLMHLAHSIEEIPYLLALPLNHQYNVYDQERKWIDYMGVALWQVTCNITYFPTPSAPPPPYTLHASNIELPPIEWPNTEQAEIRLWSTKSEGNCKRSPTKVIQSAIIQNLLRLANNSSDISKAKQEPRIVEILEDSEEEGGAPLHKPTRMGCISPTFRQKRDLLSLPKTYISRAASEDTVSANMRFTSIGVDIGIAHDILMITLEFYRSHG
jgi:hypothetical protein